MSSLPYSPEAESGFIAKLLVEPSAIPTLVGQVDPEDFHDEVMGRAWQVMIDNAGDPRRLDWTVLRAKGVDLGDWTEFMQRGNAPAAAYAEIIRLDASKRRGMAALEAGKRRIRSATTEAGVLEAVQEATSGVLSSHGAARSAPWPMPSRTTDPERVTSHGDSRHSTVASNPSGQAR